MNSDTQVYIFNFFFTTGHRAGGAGMGMPFVCTLMACCLKEHRDFRRVAGTGLFLNLQNAGKAPIESYA